jgi:hypothetical protein
MDKNTKVIFFLIIVAIIVSGYYFFFLNKQTDKNEGIKQEEISKSDLIAKDLVSKYQAITGEGEELTYTLQAQERFITGKPVLFTGAYVDDIFNREGKIFIRFSSSWFSNNDYVLELECNREIVDKILSQKGGNDFYDFDGEYMVVATIQEVAKPLFALKGSALSEDEVELDIESSRSFIAKGACVDIAYIGAEK